MPHFDLFIDFLGREKALSAILFGMVLLSIYVFFLFINYFFFLKLIFTENNRGGPILHKFSYSWIKGVQLIPVQRCSCLKKRCISEEPTRLTEEPMKESK